MLHENNSRFNNIDSTSTKSTTPSDAFIYAAARESRQLVIIEGEYDELAFRIWLHGWPAKAVAAPDSLQSGALDNIPRVLAIPETGDTRDAFIDKLKSHLHEIDYKGRLIFQNLTANEINELYKQNPENFKTALANRLDFGEKTDSAIEKAVRVVESAIKRAADEDDCGAPFENDVVEALRVIYQQDRAAYARYRAQFKRANRDVLITQLDQIVYKGDGGRAAESETIADILVTMVKNTAELFHDGEVGYACFEEDDHEEVWPLDSRGFREWLTGRYYRETGRALRDAAITDALVTLNGIAKFDGAKDFVWLRCARHEDRYYVDLCNERWQAVEIGPDGWRVVDRPPVRFRRTAKMAALPTPERDGDLDRLWDNVNLAEADRPLILAYILECWRPDTHFIIKEVVGEQGTGKSDVVKRIRQLIDPSTIPLSAAPSKTEDVYVAAANKWLVSLNNLSHLTTAQQDALCNLATGGAYGGRTLFTNTDETAVDVQRPVSLNGINALATRPDLLDRVLRFQLPLIKKRRLDSDLNVQFERDRPKILGALFDLFSKTLRELPNVAIPADDLPRMADFATLGEAMYRAMGNQPGAFNQLYKRKQADAVLMALDASPVAAAVQAYMTKYQVGQGYKGTLKDFLNVLESHRQDSEAWPKSAKGLADALRRHQPGLRMIGIGVHFDPQRRKDGYYVAVNKQEPTYVFFENFNRSSDKVHQVHRSRNHLNNNEKNGEHWKTSMFTNVHQTQHEVHHGELGVNIEKDKVHRKNYYESEAYESGELGELYPGNYRNSQKKGIASRDVHQDEVQLLPDATFTQTILACCGTAHGVIASSLCCELGANQADFDAACNELVTAGLIRRADGRLWLVEPCDNQEGH